MGPHEANIRGEIALEQVRAVQEATWPGVQHDLEVGRVREIAQVHVVPVEEPLTPEGTAFGIELTAGAEPAPVAPNLIAMPGRYRGWVLPTSGVAVALEALDDETSYQRAYRAHVLALQGITDDAVLERIRARIDEGPIVKKNPHSYVISFGDINDLRVSSRLFSRLFIGVPLRRHVRFFRTTIIEPIAPKDAIVGNVGPYR